PATTRPQSSATLDHSQFPVKLSGRYRSRCEQQLNGTTQVPRCELSRSHHRLFSLVRARLRVLHARQTPASACPYTFRYSCKMIGPGTIGYGACNRTLYIIAERIQDSLISFHPPVTFRSGGAAPIVSIEQQNHASCSIGKRPVPTVCTP